MNSTQTTSHEPTQYFHTHTHTHTTNHNTDSLLTHSYHTTSICMEHSSLIFYLTIQAQRATTPTQTISVRASVSVAQPHTCTCTHTHNHSRCKSMWMSGALFNLQFLQCVMSVHASVLTYTVSTYTLTHLHTPAHTNTQTHSTTIKQ